MVKKLQDFIDSYCKLEQKCFHLNYLKSKDIEFSIFETLNQEYNSYVTMLKDLLRIACFPTSPYSQLMWGG